MTNVSEEILSASLEDYLEAIFQIIEVNKVARPKEIAKSLNVKQSSVTEALKNLAEKQYVNYAPYENVTLTSKGAKLARNIFNRHKMIFKFFTDVLKVNDEEANEIACSIEHKIKGDAFRKFTAFMNFLEKCPKLGESWIKKISSNCANVNNECEKCTEINKFL